MTASREPLPSSSSSTYLPPNDSLPKRFKVLWRILLISNFALSAYMFASARKRHFNELENDQVEKQSDSEIITEIPSTIMVDTTGIVTENVLEDQQQEPNQGVVSGWREKLGFSRKMN
ncbi:hypothetical protein IC582_003065 [Cucumis melo]|uniref:Uncharacterized protein LOC103492320 n=1 Tax=Cucumis melo TaxID=3656 RepID=A0A1S3BR82_CUCME|nr:uncharacterized protein LOC103492320 [Cucumis melo]